jgi:hypothetical protein
MTTKDGIVARDSDTDITLRITRAMVAGAICKHPQNCVMAQALAAEKGDAFLGCWIGAAFTKVLMRDENGIIYERRYANPKKLSQGIRIFDTTGTWTLGYKPITLKAPVGTQKLGGGGRGDRRNKVPANPNGKPHYTKGATKADPTRFIPRAKAERQPGVIENLQSP